MPHKTTRNSSGIPSPTSSRSGTTRTTTAIGGMNTTIDGITTRSPLSTLTTTGTMSGFLCATTVTTAKVMENELSVDVISDYDDDDDSCSGEDEDSPVSSDIKPFQHLKDQVDSLRNTLRYAFPIQLRERLTSFNIKTELNPSLFWNGLVVVLSFCENMQALSLTLPGWVEELDDEDEHREAYVAPPHAALRRLEVLEINILDELEADGEHTTRYIDPIFRSLTLPSVTSITITNDMESELIECPAYTFMECQERSGSGFSLTYLSVDGIEWNTNHLIELLHRSPTLVEVSITRCPFDFGKLLRKLEVRPNEEYDDYDEEEEEEEEEGITYAVEVHRHEPLFNFLPNLKIFELVVPPMERAYHPLSITSREVAHVLASRWDSDYGDGDYDDDDDDDESENEDDRVYCRLEEAYLCLPRPIMYGPDSMVTVRRLESEGMKLKLKSN